MHSAEEQQNPAEPLRIGDEARVRLNWKDLHTNELRSPLLKTPIALGREFAQMPNQVNNRQAAKVVFESHEVSRYHAAIEWAENQLIITDQNSANGLYLNGETIHQSPLKSGDTLKLGPYTITIKIESIPQVFLDPNDTMVTYEDEADVTGNNLWLTPHAGNHAEQSALLSDFDVFELTQHYLSLKEEITLLEGKLTQIDELYKQSVDFLEEQQQISDWTWSQINDKFAQFEEKTQGLSLTDQAIEQPEALQESLMILNQRIEEIQDSLIAEVDVILQKHENQIREMKRDIQNIGRFTFLGIAGVSIGLLITWFLIFSSS